MTLLSDSGHGDPLGTEEGSSTRTRVTRPSVTRGGLGAFRYLPALALASDAAIIALTALLASIGRARLAFFDTPADISDSVAMVAPLIVVGWLAAIFMYGGYRRHVFGAGTEEFRRVLTGSLLAAGIIGVASYLVKYNLSRGFFLLLFVAGVPLLILGRAAIRWAVHAVRRRGVLGQRVVIAGSTSHIDEVASVLRRESWLGYHVIGAVTPATDVRSETGFGIPVLGNADEAPQIMEDYEADVIFFAGGAYNSAKRLRETVWELEAQSVHVVIAPNVTDVSAERIKVRPVGGLPLMHVDPPRWAEAARWGKRIFDFVGSGALILALSPIFVVAAWRIKRYDRGPLLFRQTRVGRHGEEFSCLKFRTMVVGADKLARTLQQEVGQDALLFKMKDDPRITKPGKWLRRFSIDELPQLLNVWRGDMSLVGPRPQIESEVALYEGGMSRRLRVRPGMTGLWQVSGRSDLSAEEAIRLDLYYVDNWSMVQDLSILARTLGAVLGSRGAY